MVLPPTKLPLLSGVGDSVRGFKKLDPMRLFSIMKGKGSSGNRGLIWRSKSPKLVVFWAMIELLTRKG